MNNNIYILSEPVRSGKTTQLLKWATSGNAGKHGILTPDFSGKRVMINLFSNDAYLFETEDVDNSILIGNFKFSKDAFLRAQQALSEALQSNCEWLIVDEIGKLEINHHSGFEPVITQVIKHYRQSSGNRKLLLVIRDYLLHDAMEHYQLQGASLLPVKDLLPGRNKITGVVLCGGKSSRMNMDKSMLLYHGKPQRFHVYDMLRPFCDKVFISVNDTNQVTDEKHYNYLADDERDIGPMAGLLRAFKNDPGSDVVLIGCDYPFLTERDIEQLIHQQDDCLYAAGYYNTGEDLFEPLLSFYKSSCYPLLRYSLAQQHYSLQKFLLAAGAKKITPADADVTRSIDDVNSYRDALERIKRKG